ncbi:spermatogenesis associated 2-like isoform X2 [Mugil cephalus]|nr:spermatogenesis associated 2-like isoform X2 [Mugil cephalus]
MSGKDLVVAYALSLERQIAERDSGLVCRDEEVFKKLEELMKEGGPEEVHCWGLDPLRVMEESLKAAAAAPGCSRRPTARGGLHGLAQAFEVLEQAALNLYVGPWRKEYKVMKMYSGMFTHHVMPVLSMPQIENLFGLLGYELSPSQPEQLCLQAARGGGAACSPDDLLRLACGFFAARCECRLILEALGKHGGDVQWEQSMVKERQRGNSLQVALDNTKKTLEVCQPQMEPPRAGEEDLYGDELLNGGQRKVLITNDDGPSSSMWGPQSIISAPAVKTHNNGVSSPLESDTDKKEQDRRPGGESRPEKTDSNLQVEVEAKREPEVNHYCSCLQTTSHHILRQCIECNVLHDFSCVSINACISMGHTVEFTDEMEPAALLPQRGSLRGKKEQDRLPGGESRSVKTESNILQVEVEAKREPEVNHYCSCFQSPGAVLTQCIECNTLHDIACDSFTACRSSRHKLEYPVKKFEDIQKPAAVSPQRGSFRGKKEDRLPGGESRSVKTASQSSTLHVEVKGLSKREPELDYYHSCLQSSPSLIEHCSQCNALHDFSCAIVSACRASGHRVELFDTGTKEPAAVSPQRGSFRGKKEDRLPGRESRSVKTESLQVEMTAKREPEVNYYCSCLQSPNAVLKQCIECNTFHDIDCAFFDVCRSNGHIVEYPEEVKESPAVSPVSKTHIGNTARISALAVHNDPKSVTPSLPPITFHHCCDLNQLDPRLLCRTCQVFHNSSCPDKDRCQRDHDVRELGQCFCGRYCSRKPLVLCRYCGREYCSQCWYKTPVSCTCGQTFDQGSPV